MPLRDQLAECGRRPLAALSKVLVWIATAAAAGVVARCLDSLPPLGIASLIVAVVTVGASIIFFARPDKCAGTSRTLLLIYAAALTLSFVLALVVFGVGKIVPWAQPVALNTPAKIAILFLAGVGGLVLVVSAARKAFKRVPNIKHPTRRAFAFTFSVLSAGILLPAWPVFLPESFARSTAGIWDPSASEEEVREAAEKYFAERRRRQQKAAQIERAQSRLLDTALSSIEPRAANRSNIFLVGLAGWSEQDVFEHETEQSVAILKSRFDVGSRAISLLNAEDTIDRYPLASIQNLSSALRAIGKRMDRERDVLILTMTSHGSQDGFALQYDDLIYRDLDPATLKSLLDDAGIKNRILIVAACYSGVFVPVLKDDNTMIMTAASATRTSFGCASGRRWTYFGDAFFDHGLKHERTLTGAFSVARRVIGEWETDQKLTPSDPQIFVGPSIARRFPEIVGDTRQQALQPATAAVVSTSDVD